MNCPSLRTKTKGPEMASKKVLSIAMDSEFQDKVKELADKKKISVSSLIRETLEKYLFAEHATTKLVLNIPKDITDNQEKLQMWLQTKCGAILRHFSS